MCSTTPPPQGETAQSVKAWPKRSLAGEGGEFLDHALIDRPLERHDQRRQVLHRLPAPADEFGLVDAAARTLDVDLGIRSREAQGKPLLPLAAIASFPG